MYFIAIILCSLVLAVINGNNNISCHPLARDAGVSSRNLRNTSLFDDKIQPVTINDKYNAYSDNSDYDESTLNTRESLETSPEPPYQQLYTDHDDGPTYNVYESTDDDPTCILARSEFYLSWWVNENGSLRVPTFNRLNTSGILDLSLQFDSESRLFQHVLNFTSDNPNDVIRFMSVANNKLDSIPASVLNLTSATIQYLSLAGNNFYGMFEYENTTFQDFTSFPLMMQLLELDLRSCHITSFSAGYFDNLPKLDKLFLSHNHFLVVKAEAFEPLKLLRHLDISYNTVAEDAKDRTDGMILEEALFKSMDQLMFLDLSHSPLSRRSMQAFKSLGPEMKQLSLCYTGITSFEENMFANTSLNVIDLSGNPDLADNISAEDFESVEDTLEIFVFRDGNVKDFKLTSSLKKLRMLDFRSNNVTSLRKKDFDELPDLEILDLGLNHIINWYERVFTDNRKLRILNLRKNNITFMREYMIGDFYQIGYLAIGSNDFVCACNLRDFIDRATRNALYHYCSDRKRKKRSIESSINWNSPEHQYNVFLREFSTVVAFYEESYRNMLISAAPQPEFEGSGESGAKHSYKGLSTFSERDCYSFDRDKITHMNFNFLLLDYNENEYKCIEENFGYQTERRVHFNQVQSCFSDIDRESTEPYDGSSDDESNEEITEDPGQTTTEPSIEETTTKSPVYRPLMEAFEVYYLYLLLIIPVSLIIGLWLWKRSDIKYFCSLFKNSLILSLDKDDKKTLMMTSRKKSTNSNIIDDYQYDVFVSYSDKDRSWVLDELIPNIEKRAEINICLHERDFQVGLSILENIIQCMDKSRTLLLVISESFLKSNWCAFEMHLAQHRLIETRREQLILVLLQDIPRSRRTRTLQFLMRTKTYIMWPSEDKEESKAMFWKRLRKAIVLTNWEPDKKVSKPRHSIV